MSVCSLACCEIGLPVDGVREGERADSRCGGWAVDDPAAQKLTDIQENGAVTRCVRLNFMVKWQMKRFEELRDCVWTLCSVFNHGDHLKLSGMNGRKISFELKAGRSVSI